MNMTPLIDVVFQLLIFFLLVNQIMSEETVQMIVPELDEPKTYELGPENRISVNLVPQDYPTDRKIGDLNIPGEAKAVRIGIKEFPADDMKGITAAMQEVKQRSPDIQVLLRADAATYYDQVSPILQAIAAAQITKVNLVAYLPEDQR